MQKRSVFDRMIEELIREDSGAGMLENCMELHPDTSKRVPLRYRLIALGFVRRYRLEELNEKLQQAGCARLYSRSIWEAGVMYAFLQGMSWERWKPLQTVCTQAAASVDTDGSGISGGSITLADLERYTERNSEISGHALLTGRMTERIEQGLRDVKSDEGFMLFLRENLEHFSRTREKTRYYFCKYLSFYLNDKISCAVRALDSGKSVDEAARELYVFRGMGKLRRKKYCSEQIRDFLRHAPLSCGGIFDEFSYFYFEYVSTDWVEALLEYYGNTAGLTREEKHSLAESLRRRDAAVRSLSDEEVIRRKTEEIERMEEEKDRQYALEGKNHGYQKNRSGENTVRKFLKGTLDIDRTTLLCFLLFFGEETNLPAAYAITEERLNEILRQCGFPGLTESDGFDSFVVHYLTAQNPKDYLMDEVTRYALREENFYLYQIFRPAYSYEKVWRKLLDTEEA